MPLEATDRMLAELFSGALADAETRRAQRPMAVVEAAAIERAPALNAYAALAAAPSVKIIAEIKRASPSRGPLAEIRDPALLARLYEKGGASAISVLTEGRQFGGTLNDLETVRAAVNVPILRKDFIANPYQVFEARAAGADLVLLIVAALTQQCLVELHKLITELGMTPLVETHNAHEISRAIDVGAQIIGVNARDLTTFQLDQDLFSRLVEHIPSETTKVAESAVSSINDVARYRNAGADVVLIGEALVTGDPVSTLHSFLAI
jgi:indole-3-glycerol phosphate synthase